MTSATLLSICFAVALSAAPAAGQGPVGTSGSPAPVPMPSPRANGAPATDVANDYRLVVGDKLRVEVYKDAQLSQSVQIRPDGKITLPLVGDLVAAGQTPLALGNSIATFLKENQYIASPVVTVIVVETQPPTISVMGEVNSPGPQQLRGQLSIIEALAAAGGFKDFANTKNIIVQRATKSGVQRIKFNYNDAIKQEGKPFYLQAGDIVIVP